MSAVPRKAVKFNHSVTHSFYSTLCPFYANDLPLEQSMGTVKASTLQKAQQIAGQSGQ